MSNRDIVETALKPVSGSVGEKKERTPWNTTE